MQNSQSSELIVTQLLEIADKLAAQEVELTLQLQSIGEKRHSLKNVISLFSPGDTVTPTTVTTPIPVTAEQPQPTTPEVALPESNGAIANNTAEAPIAPITGKRQGKKNTSSKQRQKSISTKEPSKNTNDWQQYVKDDFGNATLSEAVAKVMQQQPARVLEITAIINTIFVDEIPKQVKSIARERVSNVLSVGAKSGKWYRGQLGKYSMSQAAVEG